MLANPRRWFAEMIRVGPARGFGRDSASRHHQHGICQTAWSTSFDPVRLELGWASGSLDFRAPRDLLRMVNKIGWGRHFIGSRKFRARSKIRHLVAQLPGLDLAEIGAALSAHCSSKECALGTVAAN